MAVVALAARVICSSIYIYKYIYIYNFWYIYIYFFFHRGPKRFYNPKQRRLPGEAGRTVECNMQSHRKPNANCALEKRKNTRGCHSKTPCPWSCDADHITRYWSRLGKLHLCGRKFPGCYDCACQARWASFLRPRVLARLGNLTHEIPLCSQALYRLTWPFL